MQAQQQRACDSATPQLPCPAASVTVCTSSSKRVLTALGGARAGLQVQDTQSVLHKRAGAGAEEATGVLVIGGLSSSVS